MWVFVYLVSIFVLRSDGCNYVGCIVIAFCGQVLVTVEAILVYVYIAL